MDYFTRIPQTIYPNLTNDGEYVRLTNILTRSSFLQEIVDNVALYYDYQIKEGETPEIIADKLYGDVGRAWIVLLFNKLFNPFYDFPLVQEQLVALITSKYDMTLESSMSSVHHYEERIARTIFFNDMFQSSTYDVVQVSALVQDPVTGLAVPRTVGESPLPSVDTCMDISSTTDIFGGGITVITDRTICAVSYYTYEVEENEKRRSIKLLDAQYVGNVEAEFQRLMRNG
jgi:hypothetical protein